MSRPKRLAPPPELIRFLEPYEDRVRNLALAVRRVVLEEMAPCHENIYDAYSAVAIAYGPTDRLKDGVCHVAVYARHVNIGFNHGSTLDDPSGLLQGSGASIRHISIADLSDLRRPEIRAYLRRARKQATWPQAGRSPTVVSTVKKVYARKRRPGRVT